MISIDRLIEVYDDVSYYTLNIAMPNMRSNTPETHKELISEALDEAGWDIVIQSIEPTAQRDAALAERDALQTRLDTEDDRIDAEVQTKLNTALAAAKTRFLGALSDWEDA